MSAIRHVWFDFSDTIAKVNRPQHDQLKYDAFARLSGIPHDESRVTEYHRLYEEHGHSNANLFAQEFGQSSDFWSQLIASGADGGLYELADPAIPEVLRQMSRLVLVSIFSNVDTEQPLQALGVDTALFTNILSSSELTHPKPHTEGYKKIIELSGLPADQILYIGDIETKDIIPAKAVGLQAGIIWNRSAEADYNFSNFQQILDLVEAQS